MLLPERCGSRDCWLSACENVILENFCIADEETGLQCYLACVVFSVHVCVCARTYLNTNLVLSEARFCSYECFEMVAVRGRMLWMLSSLIAALFNAC